MTVTDPQLFLLDSPPVPVDTPAVPVDEIQAGTPPPVPVDDIQAYTPTVPVDEPFPADAPPVPVDDIQAYTPPVPVDDIQTETHVFPTVRQDVWDTYWCFIVERHNIATRRMQGLPPPWTEDEILGSYKFTNVFRVMDRTSQFLVGGVIDEAHGWQSTPNDDTPVGVFNRIMLFKLFNKIETWTAPRPDSLPMILGSDEDVEAWTQHLNVLIAAGPIYSAAYVMPSGGQYGSDTKHVNNLRMLRQMNADGLPERLAQLHGPNATEDAVKAFMKYPSVGAFLAYQWVTDLGYSKHFDFDENTFTAPGPGASDGIRKCFENLNGMTETEIIRWTHARQAEEFARLGLTPVTLRGRPLSLIDIQNCFCEISKYTRVSHPDVEGVTERKRIKQKFTASPGDFKIVFPPKWGLPDLDECIHGYVKPEIVKRQVGRPKKVKPVPTETFHEHLLLEAVRPRDTSQIELISRPPLVQSYVPDAATVDDVAAAGGYSVLYVDPPWHYTDKTPTKGADDHYPTMTFEQLKALPVEKITAESALLFMWGVFPLTPEAMELLRAWGFSYKTIAFLWVKTRGEKIHFGQGRYTRGNAEPCWLGVRGRGIDLVQDHATRQLLLEESPYREADTLFAPVTRHSAKPPEARERIEQLCGDVPRIELFSRGRVKNWDSWGNEVESDIILT